MFLLWLSAVPIAPQGTSQTSTSLPGFTEVSFSSPMAMLVLTLEGHLRQQFLSLSSPDSDLWCPLLVLLNCALWISVTRICTFVISLSIYSSSLDCENFEGVHYLIQSSLSVTSVEPRSGSVCVGERVNE